MPAFLASFELEFNNAHFSLFSEIDKSKQKRFRSKGPEKFLERANKLSKEGSRDGGRDSGDFPEQFRNVDQNFRSVSSRREKSGNRSRKGTSLGFESQSHPRGFSVYERHLFYRK